MHFNDTMPSRAYCGGLAIICSILLLLFAAQAMARPAHHLRHVAQAHHGDMPEEPRIAGATHERRRGPAHHRGFAARSDRESERRFSSAHIHH